MDISKKAFLVNKANTKQLIFWLINHLTKAGIECTRAKADVDRLITISAIKCAKYYETVVHA